MLIPVGTQHLKAPYLTCRAYMASYAGTDVIVTDTNKAYGIAYICRQTIC